MVSVSPDAPVPGAYKGRFRSFYRTAVYRNYPEVRMLVTFECSAYANITMTGKVAVALLKKMGFTGNVPGAVRAEDIPGALESLRNALAAADQGPPADQPKEDNEEEVSLGRRAYPLVQLMEAAAREEVPVTWQQV